MRQYFGRIAKLIYPVVRTIRYLIYYNCFKKRHFTIISNNCWGGTIYKRFGLKYQTPFVGLFLFAPDYLKLLKNLDHYLGCELSFARRSKYEMELIKNGTLDKYPIGLLDDIELHFIHYKSEYEAKQKWLRRLNRINWDSLYVEFSDRDLCTESLLEEFDKLPFEHKVCFTAKNHPQLRTCYWLEEFNDEPFVGQGAINCSFDVLKWLNK